MDNHLNKFLISYIGLADLPETEQEEIMGYVWNSIHNRIFDLLITHIDRETLDNFERRFEKESEKVFLEIKEIYPDFDKIARRAVDEVINEFKKVRDSIKV